MTKGLSKPFNTFICFTCPKFATTMKELHDHKNTKEHLDRGVLCMASNTSDYFRCEICNKVTILTLMGFGLTPLLGDRRGFMPPQLKTKQYFIEYN